MTACLVEVPRDYLGELLSIKAMQACLSVSVLANYNHKPVCPGC